MKPTLIEREAKKVLEKFYAPHEFSFSARPSDTSSEAGYFKCSCGASGSMEESREAALDAHAEHTARVVREVAAAAAALAAPQLLRACENIANEIEHWKHEPPPTREMRQGCVDELRAAAALARRTW